MYHSIYRRITVKQEIQVKKQESEQAQKFLSFGAFRIKNTTPLDNETRIVAEVKKILTITL